MKRYILSLDQGTTSSRAMLFDAQGNTVAVGQREFAQHFPKPGWVEHDAEEILKVQLDCVQDCLKAAGISGDEIACIGITNQRETTVVWNKKTGKPVYRAIVWQCRRTQEIATTLKTESDEFRLKTGLVPDAYFSGPKIAWILDNVPDARKQAEAGELIFGTIDTWLIWNLTGGSHLTEASNASRTMLFNVQEMQFDKSLLKRLNIPESMMPQVLPSNANFGKTKKEVIGFEAPITGVLGDQQAALYGQGCLTSGMAKCTYGTGAFMLVNIGNTAKLVPGLLTTVGWHFQGEKPIYALEGAIFICGAAIQWLRDGLNILDSSDQAEALATSISGNDGVYFVPALVGLGSPWWNSDVRGTITGITRGTTRAHFVRAALESMAYQVKDVASDMESQGLKISELRVDGGATQNNFLLQIQADLLEAPILRSGQAEATAWGAAALAGVSAGVIAGHDEVAKLWVKQCEFNPKQDRKADYAGWQNALAGAFTVAGFEHRKKSGQALARV